MKGCLSLIIKTIIAVLVFFGLLHLGVIDFIKDKIHEYNTPSQEEIVDKTKDVADLSEIDDEYTVDKNLKILQNRMIIAEHNSTGQKMIIIEPKSEDILTKKDIEDENAQEKINEIVNKYKYKVVKFDKIEVTKHGEMEGLNQTIPYIKIDAGISNLPVKDIEGIVGVAELQNGKNLIIISVNEKGKYSQIVADAFYKKVK
ncbi:MAG: hypothetical protein LUH05_02100 [Candidatus Gastranaerophilales bacterium]|nr:hypothetical protein [Candidatus Gastranaerophilales bacterium]